MDVADVIKLSEYNAPSYIIGIDHNADEPFQSKAYIGTIRGYYGNRISSLPTTYPLNDANLILLQNEVIAFWTALNPLRTKQNYLTNFAI